MNDRKDANEEGGPSDGGFSCCLHDSLELNGVVSDVTKKLKIE